MSPRVLYCPLLGWMSGHTDDGIEHARARQGQTKQPETSRSAREQQGSIPTNGRAIVARVYQFGLSSRYAHLWCRLVDDQSRVFPHMPPSRLS